METKKEYIIYLLKFILERKKFFKTGLCNMIFYFEAIGIIDCSDYWILKRYFKENFPKNGYMIGLIESNYKWMPGNWEPREKWLLEQIEKLEKEVKNEKH